MTSVTPLRTLGSLTAAYGVFALARPGSLARQADLGDPLEPPTAVRLLAATFGVRDLLSGFALLTAPAGPLLRAAVAARVLFDVGDAVTLAGTPPANPRRRRLAAMALAWGCLSAACGVVAGRDGIQRVAVLGADR